MGWEWGGVFDKNTYLFDQSFSADDVKPCTLFYQIDSDRILKVLLGDVLPDRASHAPDVLEPISHVLIGRLVSCKAGQLTLHLRIWKNIFNKVTYESDETRIAVFQA